MKKFIALTLGLSIFGAAVIIPFSSASRDAYHSYLTKKTREKNRYRHSTDYKGPLSRNSSTRIKKGSFIKSNLKGLRYRNSFLPKNKRNLYSSFSNNKNLKLRTSSNRIIGTKVLRKNNNYRVPLTVNRKINIDHFLFENYSNDAFSLEIPKSSETIDSDEFLQATVSNSNVGILAKKLDNKCGKNFYLCARSISRTMDRESEIYRVSKTFQQYQKTDSVLGSVGHDSLKYIEGFVGETLGSQGFIARFITKGNQDELFLVEISSDLKEIDLSVVLAKRLFESFRAKY